MPLPKQFMPHYQMNGLLSPLPSYHHLLFPFHHLKCFPISTACLSLNHLVRPFPNRIRILVLRLRLFSLRTITADNTLLTSRLRKLRLPHPYFQPSQPTPFFLNVVFD